MSAGTGDFNHTGEVCVNYRYIKSNDDHPERQW